MARPKPIAAALADLEAGQYADCFVILAERTKGATRDGKPYYVCRFRDARRSATVMIWLDGGRFEECESNWHVGRAYKVRAVYYEHEKYGPQLELEQIREVVDGDRDHGFDPTGMVETSRFDPDAMMADLRMLIETEIGDEPLRKLVSLVLEKHAEKLRWVPGSLKHYFPFAGGWLEHTLSLTRNCLMLADRYRMHYPELSPPLNRDLLIAAALLHDVGRAAEYDEPLAPQPTVEGRLLGHLFLGRDLVRDAARDVPELNPELLRLLEHLVISHLNHPEWGSPRLPLIPECLILHHLDDLDAKMEMYVRCLTRDMGPGDFTERDPILGRQLYKGREV